MLHALNLVNPVIIWIKVIGCVENLTKDLRMGSALSSAQAVAVIQDPVELFNADFLSQLQMLIMIRKRHLYVHHVY
jgi:hypothetical protein